MSHVAHPDFQRQRYFRPRPQSIVRRVLSRYQVIELFVIIGAIFLLWGGSSLGPVSSALKDQAPSGWLESVRIDIIDGDLIRSGRQVYRPRRLQHAGIRDNAKCPRERALAVEATRRLQQLVAGGELDFGASVALPTGTEGTGQCNYGRLCGTLKVGGRDVGAILIAEGLAERYACGAASCPPRRNWCLS
jgi:hypothetical protein